MEWQHRGYDLRLKAINRSGPEELANFPQQGALRLSGPLSGQDAGGGARTRDRRIHADIRVDSLAAVLPKPPIEKRREK
ncbi:hypothetical protein PoB_001081600 [Plakobranchus ocellatus]|uniref:Uncharacterized protein n=1 Tax=Plakobranchus ocellatus TaxID=259542 RepID=A0AAV3YPH1_9GAST|nr:hypothetical protein PoB_001081600 [Plakobranchus ocellatus]